MASALDPYTPTEKAAVTNGQPIDPTTPGAAPTIPGLEHLSANPSLANYQEGQQNFAGQQLQRQQQQISMQQAAEQRAAGAEMQAFASDPTKPKGGYYALDPYQQQDFQKRYPTIAPQIPGLFNAAQSEAAGRPVGANITDADQASGEAGGVKFATLPPTSVDANGQVSPSLLQGTAKMVASMELNPELGRMTPTQKMRVYQMAKQINPQFDAQDYETRLKARESFYGNSKNAQSILSANTFAGHAGQAYDLVDAMDNGNKPGLNSITNKLGDLWGTANSTNRLQFQTAAHTMATEYAKALSGGVPNEGEIKEYEALLSPNLGPDTLKRNIQQMAHAVGERLGNLQQEYNNTVKSTRPEPFLTQPAQATLARIGVNTGAPEASPAPGAAPQAPPVLTDRSQFDALPSGAIYIRDGRRYQKP